jgi:uncharacterized protein
MYYIKQTQEFGRGLYATADIKVGQVIFAAELLVLSPEDTVKVNQTDLQYYTFVYNETQDCLVLGDGELFNHSDTANIGYRLEDYDGPNSRKIMIFYAIQDIPQHDQLFTDYNQDTKVNTDSYKVSLL